MIKRRANIKREREKRSLIDGLSTKVFDKDGKVIFNGKDDSAAIIKRVNPLGGK